MPAMRPQSICDRWYEYTIECGPGVSAVELLTAPVAAQCVKSLH